MLLGRHDLLAGEGVLLGELPADLGIQAPFSIDYARQAGFLASPFVLPRQIQELSLILVKDWCNEEPPGNDQAEFVLDHLDQVRLWEQKKQTTIEQNQES